MKIVLLLLALVSSIQIYAEEVQNVQLLVRIEDLKADRPWAMRFKDKSLEEIIKGLVPGDEAIIEGHISYDQVRQDSNIQMNPTLVIEKIRPISLKRLGKMDDFKVEEKPMNFKLIAYAPKGLPISDAVLAGITITASILLLKNLSAIPQDSQFREQTNKGLMFSAGALATGIAIIDQLNTP